ncbi:MAG: glyoxalase [Renibacterium sp.]|nr:glyoxalase [Renibacterium sp.]
MAETGIRANEATVPVLHCVSAEQTVDFFQALGFETTYQQRKPYLYLAFRWSGFEVHYGSAPADVDPAREETGGCLVMVDSVAPYHASFSEAMRRRYGKVLARGLPRITRYRPGASRFTLMDPSGNAIIFIQRDEPEDLEYGGAKALSGLAKTRDNARILRDFKNDEKQAFRALKSALRRHGMDASAAELAITLCWTIELAESIGEDSGPWLAQLRGLEISGQPALELHAAWRESGGHAERLADWLAGQS